MLRTSLPFALAVLLAMTAVNKSLTAQEIQILPASPSADGNQDDGYFQAELDSTQLQTKLQLPVPVVQVSKRQLVRKYETEAPQRKMPVVRVRTPVVQLPKRQIVKKYEITPSVKTSVVQAPQHQVVEGAKVATSVKTPVAQTPARQLVKRNQTTPALKAPFVQAPQRQVVEGSKVATSVKTPVVQAPKRQVVKKSNTVAPQPKTPVVETRTVVPEVATATTVVAPAATKVVRRSDRTSKAATTSWWWIPLLVLPFVGWFAPNLFGSKEEEKNTSIGAATSKREQDVKGSITAPTASKVVTAKTNPGTTNPGTTNRGTTNRGTKKQQDSDVSETCGQDRFRDESVECKTAVSVAGSDSATDGCDDLTKIHGVGSATAKLLNENGIASYQQLADFEGDRLQLLLNKAGSRFQTMDCSTWSRQARFASRGDWLGLDVWSQQYKREQDSSSSLSDSDSSSETIREDDLTKINGIGPATAKVLSANGVTSFDQVAITTETQLKDMLADAGARFKMINPTSWPQQAIDRLEALGRCTTNESSLLGDLNDLQSLQAKRPESESRPSQEVQTSKK